MRPCDRTVALNFSEIAQYLGFERKNAQFTTVLPFLGHFSNLFVGFWPILFAQTFQTEILVAPKKSLLESLTRSEVL